MSKEITANQTAARSFERKIRLAKWASAFEQLWVRMWWLVAVACIFAIVTLGGLWAHLGDVSHMALLGLFGLAALASIIYAARISWPSRDDAIRRIERRSGAQHRPASSYEDTLTASASDPATRAIWQAHRSRMAEAMARLKPGAPKPRTDVHDPYAVRALLALGVLAGVALTGDQLFERLGRAFHLSSFTRLAEARLDAWVTPPAYTMRPPLMLADGSNPLGSGKTIQAANSDGKPLTVPDRSVVIVRASGIGNDALSLEIAAPGQASEIIKPETKEGDSKDVQEVRYTIRRGATLRALAGTTEVGSWTLDVTPDELPKIALTKKPELTPRGSLKLIYKVEDDYGVASAAAHAEKVKPKDADPAIAWAQSPPPDGARPPLTRPPLLSLKVPPGNPKSAEATTYLDLASHPWAGLRVMMNLEVRDVAGQLSKTKPVEMVLPERAFTKPLACAVVEQRRKLITDARYREQVVTALEALTAEPDDFIKDTRVYLSLRTVYHRLQRERSRDAISSSIEQLWQTALRIEDGDLSEAERRLRDAQERLSKALEDGASEAEIKKLMEEMKQAFNDFMQQLAKQSEKDQDQAEQDGNGDQEKFGKEELDEMMKKFEDAAKNGSREDAEKMLAEMRDVMERLQSGKKEDPQAQQRSKDLQKMMEKLVNMASEQQKLLDDTFKEKSGQDGKDPVEQRGQRGGQKANNTGKAGKSAQKGKGGQPGEGQEGQEGEGQQGDRGQDGEDGEGGEQGQAGQKGKGNSSLAARQRDLKERLAELEKQMKDARAGGSKDLNDAQESMQSAEDSLNSNDAESASESQGNALESMRESAKQLSEQLQQQASRGKGDNGKNERDPMGRPQKTTGPDLGTSVKVPDRIDTQRAREVLEEVRRRLGEPTRPEGELEYLERLQKRF